MQDFCDGKAFQEHPLFSSEKNALQLIIYYDEIETCNPLGSYTSIHKLGTLLYNAIYSITHFALLKVNSTIFLET